MSDTSADFLQRFRAWAKDYTGPAGPDAGTTGLQPAGNGLPAGLAAVVPDAQDSLYLILSGTGACQAAAPAVYLLAKTGAGVWEGSFPGGWAGRCPLDAIRLTGDEVATLAFEAGGQPQGSFDLLNGVGGGPMAKCGCGQVTARTYA